MHIVVFSHAGGSVYHGPNMRWYYMGRALMELGHKVTIVSASYFHKYISLPDVRHSVTAENIDGINYLWIRTRKYTNKLQQIYNQFEFSLKSWLLVARKYKDLDADVVIASSPHPFVIYAAHRLASKRSIPLVYEVRDLWPLVVKELSGASDWNPYIWLLKFTESFSVKRASCVASVKPGDIDYFAEKYGLEKSSYLYVPNGLYVESESKFDLPTVNERNDASGETFIVGYVGAASAYYGLKELIDAAKLLSKFDDIQFRIVGGGEDLEFLKSYSKKLDLHNIEFIGKVDKQTVAKELAYFALCYVGLKDVISNKYGISCNKIFEYMYAGKPIVASYKTDYDVVAYAKCGITVTPDSPKMLSAAILRLYQSTSSRKAMGMAGREYFMENHQFSVVARKYEECFKRLVRSCQYRT